MTPLFGEAGGWGETLEALACLLFCSIIWTVGLALAGAVFRSSALVGFSFLPGVAVIAAIPLSAAGYQVLAITLLAPLSAAVYLFIEHHSPDSLDATEVAPVVQRPTEVAEGETQPPPAEWERSGPVMFRFPVVWLFALVLLLFLLSGLAMLTR